MQQTTIQPHQDSQSEFPTSPSAISPSALATPFFADGCSIGAIFEDMAAEFDVAVAAAFAEALS